MELRNSLANNGMFGTATAIITAVWLWPSTTTMLSASSKPGTASRMSVSRIISESTQPPKAPAAMPIAAPMTAPIANETMPMINEARAP